MFGFKKKVAVAAAVIAVTTAPAAFAESLSDAMVSAYKHSGLLKQNQALLRAADEDVAIAQAALRPALSYRLGHSWEDPTSMTSGDDYWQTQASLTGELLIFNFGRGKMGIEAAKELVLSTRDSLVGVEQQVLMRAVGAFLEVRSASENAQLQSNLVRVLTQELRAANDRFEVGEVTQTDVALAKSRLAAARASEASAQGQFAIAREEYRAATGHLPGRLSTPPRFPRTAKSLDAAKAVARQRHPDILSAQHQVKAADLSVEITKAGMKPSVVGSARTTWTDRSNASGLDSFNSSVGVAVQGQIYSGGRYSAEYRKAIARAEAARAGLHQVRMAVDQNVANSWAQLAITSASLEATDRQIRASRVALKGAREEATLGSRTTLDVLNAEQELLNAQASRISAQSGQYSAVYGLLASMGLLTAEHLKLGIVTYDPEAYFNTVKSAPVRAVSPQGQKLDSILKVLGKK